MIKIILVAGGTGGHIHAAIGMGEYFKKSMEVQYITGKRYLDYQLFKECPNVKHIGAQPLRGKNILSTAMNLCTNFFLALQFLVFFLLKRPNLVLGAGGYVCGPVLLAARVCQVPAFILEQNAIAGLTNKLIAYFATGIFTNFRITQGLEKFKSKIHCVGNPVRSSIQFTPHTPTEEFHVLVFGGSLGALQINQAIQILLESSIKKSINRQVVIKHQVGKGMTFAVPPMHSQIQYQQLEYIDHIEKEYQWADLIIARAGASTLSELKIVRKPCILIPYPKATDNHQWFNAKAFKAENNFPITIYPPNIEPHLLANNIFEEMIYFNFSSIKENGNQKQEEATATETLQRIEEICLKSLKN